METEVAPPQHAPTTPYASTRSWFLLHVLIPLLPFFLSAFVRAVTSPDITWSVFDTSELAMSTGLILFFAGVSLTQVTLLLPDDEEEQRRSDAVLLCFMFAFVMIVAFTLIEVYDTFSSNMNVSEAAKPLNKIRIVAGVLFMFSMWFVLQVQKSFKLTARIL